MHLSLILFSFACVSVIAKPEIYNATLRDTVLKGKSKEFNRTIDTFFESPRNHTWFSDVRSVVSHLLTPFRHHNLTLNDTVLLNGTNFTTTQLEADANAVADIQIHPQLYHARHPELPCCAKLLRQPPQE